MVNKEDYIAQRHVNSDMTGIHFDIDRRVSPNTIRNISCGLTQDEAEFIVSACNACKSINEEHPELVAQNIKPLFDALEEIMDNVVLRGVNVGYQDRNGQDICGCCRTYYEVDNPNAYQYIDKFKAVLSKIKGGE